MEKTKRGKLALSRETLERLQRESCRWLQAGVPPPTPDSQCPIPPCVPTR